MFPIKFMLGSIQNTYIWSERERENLHLWSKVMSDITCAIMKYPCYFTLLRVKADILNVQNIILYLEHLKQRKTEGHVYNEEVVYVQ